MPTPRRRDVLGSLAAAGGAVAGCLDLDALGLDDDPEQTVALETVAGGFAAPVDVAFRPGDAHPYVVDQPGRIYRVSNPGRVGDGDSDPVGDPQVVADLRDRVVDVGDSYTERGLLGLAFHPGGDRAFVRYSAPSREGTPDGYSHTFVLGAFPVADDGTLEADAETTVLEIPQPQGNHNAGDLAFGPDGSLYVAVGDGGGAGDRGPGHVSDWYDANAGGNGQDVTENLLGSILRLDVDGDDPYAVPPDNPLVDAEGLDEHYAWGLRNPWGMSFDPATDRFVVADVGQNQYEEVNVVEAGGNYGWNVREGRHCYDASDCPTTTPDGDPLRDPVLEYDHDQGRAVVGGHVYRGNDVPALDGRYVFGDWQQRLFVADPTGDDWAFDALGVETGFDRFVLAFATDHQDELYVATDGDTNPTGDAGRVSRFAPADGDDGDGDDGTDGSDGDGSDGSDDGTNDVTTADPDAMVDDTPGFGVLAALLGGASALASRARRRR